MYVHTHTDININTD